VNQRKYLRPNGGGDDDDGDASALTHAFTYKDGHSTCQKYRHYACFTSEGSSRDWAVSVLLCWQEWEAGRNREREMAGREISRLRGSIQTLTRAANPLGKLMDFFQEDVDSMQRELGTWQRTNTDLRAQLRTEHRCVTFVCRLYFNATVNNFKERSKSITGFSLLWKHDLRSLHGIVCFVAATHNS
jgi:hypothetical protein